jgi:hypothetical protein
VSFGFTTLVRVPALLLIFLPLVFRLGLCAGQVRFSSRSVLFLAGLRTDFLSAPVRFDFLSRALKSGLAVGADFSAWFLFAVSMPEI